MKQNEKVKGKDGKGREEEKKQRKKYIIVCGGGKQSEMDEQKRKGRKVRGKKRKWE